MGPGNLFCVVGHRATGAAEREPEHEEEGLTGRHHGQAQPDDPAV